jgi:hypothetical protein
VAAGARPPCSRGHLISSEALSIGHSSADRALHVVDLAEPAFAVVTSKHDADDRLERSTRTRRPRALHLDSVSASTRRVIAGVRTPLLLAASVSERPTLGRWRAPRPARSRLLPQLFVSFLPSSTAGIPREECNKHHMHATISRSVVNVMRASPTTRPGRCHRRHAPRTFRIRSDGL